MASITHDFLEGRRRAARYGKFIIPGLLFLAVIAGSAVAGFYLYKTSIAKTQKPALATVADTTEPQLPKSWLEKYFHTDNQNDPKVGGAYGDPDQDGLNNIEEYYYGTDPTNPDTLGTGMADGAKVLANINPATGKELVPTEWVRQIADQYVEANNMTDFSRANIEKEVMSYLQTPDPNTIQIQLPDPKNLVVTKDNNPQGADAYLTASNDAAASLNITATDLQAILENSSSVDISTVLSSVYEAINKLETVPVPSDFLRLHQLQIATLSAAANVLEVAHTIDDNASLDTQKSKIQDQYYQLAVIQKLSQMSRLETANLAPKYSDVMAKYQINAST